MSTAALAQASKTISATYEQPYIKHAPIGPFVAVADVRSDGTATVWTHSANSQGLRAQIANTLSTPVEKVVVRWLDHAGQFGRTTFGGDGAEGDAAILSQLTGKPVRVQWTLQEDLAWSASSPGWVEDISLQPRRPWLRDRPAQHLLLCLNRMTRGLSALFSPACLAASPSRGYWIATEWPYDKIQNRREEVYGMPNLGTQAGAESPIGGYAASSCARPDSGSRTSRSNR